MTAEELIVYLRRQGIELWLEGDRLRYRGLRHTLPPALVSLLRKHKQVLLQLLQQPPAQGPIIPLSQQQRAFWFLQQLTPESTAYVGVVALRFFARLVPATLQHAVDRVVQRHSMLRARFELRDGTPWQRFDEQAALQIQRIDAERRSDSDVLADVRREAQRPVQLQSDPPARILLYQLANGHSILLLCIHHIYVDGWSIGILIRELAAFYRTYQSASPESMPPPTVHFEDYVVWQQQFLLSAAGEEQERFFRTTLAGDLPLLDLPTDLPRPSLRSERGAAVSFLIETEPLAALRTFAHQQGVTAYTILLAIFAIFLHQYSGQDDLLIGSPFHGRSEPRFNELVGCLINTLVLRVRLDLNRSFSDFVGDLHQHVSESFRHGDYPITRLMQWATTHRDPSRMPLFQVLFAYENFVGADVVAAALTETTPDGEGPSSALFGVPMQSVPLPQMDGQFDLALTLIETPSGLRASLSYSTDLFWARTAERMTNQLQQLLTHALARPDTPISQLSLLTEVERTRLLQTGSPPGPVLPTDLTVHARFAQQAAATPDRLAVVCADQAWTYRDLDRFADAHAARLRALGVGGGDFVAVFLQRSCAQIGALFAILKSGAAYVPLDPALPPSRLRFMLTDTGCRAVITDRRLHALLPDPSVPAVLIEPDADSPALEAPPPAPNMGSSPRPDALTEPLLPAPSANSPSATHDDKLPQQAPAYVIYTSGSTGRPRGVLITHRPMLHLWQSQAWVTYDAQRLTGEQRPLRVAMLSPITFDASVEVLLQLLSGDTLYLPTDAQRESIHDLVLLCRRHRIDILETPTSLLSAFLDTNLFSSFDYKPKQVNFGGEAVSITVWQKMAALSGVAFFNTYGPTECTVYCTAGIVDSASMRPHIGKPLPGCRIYLLDAQGQPVPIGVPGELHIGGEGVGSGYLNQPDVTRARFLPDPFSPQPNARMYKSGDLARFLPDGNIEYLGRIDTQVKLRGFRIELGEVEAALLDHPDVAEAAVVLQAPQSEHACLVAHVVPRPDRPRSIDALRQQATGRLPAYMVPTHFVFLDHLPRNSSGKIQRSALPSVGVSTQHAHADNNPPKDALEAELTAIWESLLDVRPIGRHDSFFALGGHSLLAMRMMSQVQKQLGVSLPISALLGAAAIEPLAQKVRQARAQQAPEPSDVQASHDLVPLRPGTSTQRLILLPGAGAHVLAYRDLAALLPQHIDVWALSEATHDPSASRPAADSLEDLARAQVATLRRLQPQGPYCLAGWSMGGVVAFEMARQLRHAGEDVPLLALIDSICPAVVPSAAPPSAEDDRVQFLQGLGLSDSEVPAFLAGSFVRYQRHVRLLFQYKPDPYSGPVLLLRARDNDRSRLPPGLPADYGWGPLCPGGLVLVDLPGEHHSLLRAPQVQHVAAAVAAHFPAASGR